MKRLIGLAAAGLAALAAVVVGCRDLDLPSPNSGNNPGPTLRFVSPVSAGDAGTPEVSLVSFISVDAEDADGVGEVDLSCQAGGSQIGLIRWVSTPYEGSVDLSPCHDSSDDSGDPEVTLLLTASATDALGNHSTENQSVKVRVNLDVAALAIQVPPRVSPGQPFDITVTSDRPLIGIPNVKVEGAPAQFVQALTPDGGASSFQFHTPAAPELGAASFTGPGDPPIETLEENERLIAITAEGRAENGNLTQVTAQVDVARVLWTRSLPNQLFVDVIDGPIAPLAVDGGIYVPVLATRLNQPVFFTAADGQPLLFPTDFQAAYTSIQPLGSGQATFLSNRTYNVGINSDGGIAVQLSLREQAMGVDDAGLPFWPDGGVLALDGGTSTTAAKLGVVVLPGSAALVRPTLAIKGGHGQPVQAGNYACEDGVSLSSCVFAGPPPQLSLNCIGAAGDVIVKAGSDGLTGGTMPALTVLSGTTLAMVNATGSCAGTNSPIKLAPLTAPQTTMVTWPGQQFERVLSEGNGSFFGVYFDVNVGEDLLLEFDLTTADRFSPVLLPTVASRTVSSDQLLAARPDGTVAFFAPAGLTTTFGAWRPASGTQVIGQSILPIAYESIYSVSPILTPYTQVDTDGTVYVLLWRQATSQGAPRTDIVALDPSMQVKWIFHYDKADQGRDNALRITLDRVTGQLYLVDGDNGFVVALAR